MQKGACQQREQTPIDLFHSFEWQLKFQASVQEPPASTAPFFATSES